MTKAAFIPFCLVLLVGTAPILSAQTTPVDTAVQAAIRRQADQVTLRQKLDQAAAAEQRRDLVAAAKLYGDAWSLVESIGSREVAPEAQQTAAGVTRVRMALARAAQRRGDLLEADAQVKEVLRVNPHDPEAVAFNSENKKMLVEQEGKIPSVAVKEEVPAIEKDKTAAATLVQDARLLLELGKLDEAESKLKQAYQLDKSNPAINYYGKLIQEARFKRTADRRNIDSSRKVVQVEDAWNDSVKRESLPVPNPVMRTNLIYTSSGRQAIMSKLDRIHLDTVFYDGLPLSEVIRNLSEEIKKRDPERRGINILIDPNVETISTTPVTVVPTFGGAGGAGAFAQQPAFNAAAAAQAAGGQTIDPTTGLPVAPAANQNEAVDINSVSIKINPALNDIRLADLLDAIVTVADHPIRYSIMDYAVIFHLKGPETPQLHIRRFKVDPNTFYQGLESVSGLDFSTLVPTTTTGGGGGGIGGGGGGGVGGGQGGQNSGAMTIPRVSVTSGTLTGGGGGGGVGGGGGANGQGGLGGVTRTNLMAAVQASVIQFFATVGVDLSAQNGKNVFFNDREGTLLVRATSQELDIIEAAVEALNIAPPEVNIKTKFVEVSQNDTKALGFDWYLGNFLMNNGAIGAQGGTAPSFSGSPTAANPAGTFPGSVSTTPAGALNDTTLAAATSDQLITSGLRNKFNAPALGTLTGILTDPQFRVVLRALEQREGADLLNQGEVTTLSGRQAQIQVIDLQFIVTSSGVQTGNGGGAGGVGTGAGNNNNVVQSTPLASVPTPTPIPLGPTLDVIPYVSADGYTIQMTLIPTITEFIGYDDPGPFLIQAQAVGGNGAASAPLTAVLPLPHFRVRQVTTSAIVWDGQTIVLGGLISDNVARIKDKIPVLGDLPFVGRLFRSEQSQTQKKNLVIFVTPTIIDPAGNRMHLDDELPFAQSAIPAQRPSENP